MRVLVHSYILFVCLFAHSQSARTLLQEGAPCDVFMRGMDIPGDHLVAMHTASNERCKKACEDTVGCNAAVRVDADGGCYLKNVDTAIVDPVLARGFTSILLCHETDEPGTTLAVVPTCDDTIYGFDIPGNNMAVVHDTESDFDCLAECQRLRDCNAAIRLNSNGACFLKSVNVNTVHPVKAPAFNSQLICDGSKPAMVIAPRSNDDSPAKQPDDITETLCDGFVEGVDIPGNDLTSKGDTTDAQCLSECEATPNCNALVWMPSTGACFMKTVDMSNVDTINDGRFHSRLVCSRSSSAAGGSTGTDKAAPTTEPDDITERLCDGFVEGVDIPGNDLTSQGDTTDAQCLSECKATPNCNALVWMPSTGACFMKTVDMSNVDTINDGRFHSRLVCTRGSDREGSPVDEDSAGGNSAVGDGSSEAGGRTCGTPIQNVVVSNFNFVAQEFGNSNEDCAAACLANPACNVVMFGKPEDVCILLSEASVVLLANNDLDVVICEDIPVQKPSNPPKVPLDSLFATGTPACPGETPQLPTTAAFSAITPTPGAIQAYQGANPVAPLNSLGQIELTYPIVDNGALVCAAPGLKTIYVGGQIKLRKNGACQPFPMTATGQSCCTMMMWQPDENGYYKDACTLSIALGAQGVFYWKTVAPGDEMAAGWGPDPAPHFHYELFCNGCALNSAVGGGVLKKFNKFYVDDIFTGEGANAADHLAKKIVNINGEEAHAISIVIDA